MFVEQGVFAAVMLGAVVAFDGLVPAAEGTVAFYRSPLGRWSVHQPFRIAGRGSWHWRPVGWACLIWDIDLADTATPAAALNWRHVAAGLAVLQVLALIQMLALVIGTPIAATKFGVLGVLVGLLVVMYLSVQQAAVGWPLIRRLTHSRKAAWLFSARCLWPFSSLRAADVALKAFRVDGPTLMAIVGEETLLRANRTALYDTVVGRESRRGEYWLSLLGRARVESFLDQTQGDVNAPVCPRCTCLYVAGTLECADCGVPLSS